VSTDCIFCRILQGSLPSTIVAETPSSIAIEDKFPQAPVHVLVMPRRHVASLCEASDEDRDLLADGCLLASRVAAIKGVAETGYRVLTNVGSDGGQAIAHLHWHVLGGRKLGAKLVSG
jgi:histidine triad (HIT) family protein